MLNIAKFLIFLINFFFKLIFGRIYLVAYDLVDKFQIYKNFLLFSNFNYSNPFILFQSKYYILNYLKDKEIKV